MGCLFSNSASNSSSTTTSTKFVKKSPNSNFGKPTNVDIKDYVIKGESNTFLLKTAINGMQFMVEDNTNTTIFLLDHIAQLTIDNTNQSCVVTGPIEGSCFIRDCTDCCFVIACQQLRLRNCHNCKILLFSTTGPIVESSSQIGFGCYSLSYFELPTQFDKAGLQVFENSWQYVFDFTPSTSGGVVGARSNKDNYYALSSDCDHGLQGLNVGQRLSIEDKAALMTQGYSFLTDADERMSKGQQSRPPQCIMTVPFTYGLLSGLIEGDEAVSRTVLLIVPVDLAEDARRRLDACVSLYRGRMSSSSSSSSLNSNSVASSDSHLLLVRTGLLKTLDKVMVNTLIPLNDSTTNSLSSSSCPPASAKFLKETLFTRCAAAGKSKGKGDNNTSGVITMQFLLPTKHKSTATANITATSIDDLLQLQPSGISSSSGGDYRMYYWCTGKEAVEKANLVFEQWIEKT